MTSPRVVHPWWLAGIEGVAVTPSLVLIRPARRGDVALLQHELVHCRQMHEEGTLRFWWRYFTSRAHRLRYEVQAYRVSLAFRPNSLDQYAQTLAQSYLLNISVAEAKSLLLK